MLRLGLLCVIMWWVLPLTGQGRFCFRSAESMLDSMAVRIVHPAEDAARLQHNQVFSQALDSVLQQELSWAYPFDSLRTVSVLSAPDGAFRIFTWYVPLGGQQFRYFGLIQQKEDLQDPGQSLIWLRDSTQVIDRAVFSELSADRWYGAYYYELLGEVAEDGPVYTLLGWKGDNPYTRMRVIEALHFRQGAPVFGKEVFALGRSRPMRIVFEYSARVSMSLIYDHQAVRSGEEPRPMILFDRLRPPDESLRGQYRFYVPQGDVFDALVMQNGHWVFYPDVDARDRPPEGDPQ